MADLTYGKAIANREHLIALGQTEIHLHDFNGDDIRPWDKVVAVEAGGGYRLNGPTGVRIIAKDAGLTFTWFVDFERREANGRGYALFDRERIREETRKLPAPARKQFAKFLASEVLPGLEKVTAEYRASLNMQLDSEDCVRGLIAYAEKGE